MRKMKMRVRNTRNRGRKKVELLGRGKQQLARRAGIKTEDVIWEEAVSTWLGKLEDALPDFSDDIDGSVELTVDAEYTIVSELACSPKPSRMMR